MGSLKWSNLHSRYDVRITLMGKLNEQPTHLYITKANSLCKINLGKLWEMVRDRDREAWCAVTHGVAKSRTQLADWTMSQILELWQVPKLFLWGEVKWMKVTQSCLTLCNPMDYTVHVIIHARILEWVAVFFSRGSSQPGDGIQVSCIAGRFITSWATREAK